MSVVYTNMMDNYTVCGHIIGMLDRDQRTAKLRCDSIRQSAMFSVFHNHSHYLHTYPYDKEFTYEKISRRYLLKRKSSHTPRSRKNSHLWNTLIRLKKVLFVGIYLLSLINIPYSLAAPINQMAEGGLPEEWWINPLPLPTDTILSNSNSNPNVNDTHLLTSIAVATTSALQSANQLFEEFTDWAYHQNDSAKFYDNWKEVADEWNWLPTRHVLHKELHKPVDKSYLETLKAEAIGYTLNNNYRYLQMTAVGLEQIVLDKDKDDPLYTNFSESRHRLRLVLIEVQNALVDHEMYKYSEEHIRMDSIPASYRSLNGNVTFQNMRDLIIYAAYINTLEFVLQVSNYLQNP